MAALGGVLDAIACSQLCAGDRKLAVRRAIEVSLLGAAALAQPVQYEDESDKLEVQQVALQVLGCKAVPKALTLLREDGHVDLAKRLQKLSRVRNRAAHPDGKAFVVALQQAYAGKTSDKDEGSVGKEVDYQEEKPKEDVEDGDKDNIEKAMQDTLKTKLGDIQEAEKCRAEDESTKDKVEQKNGLEKYCYAMRNTLQDEKLKEKSEDGDKDNIDKRKTAVDKLKGDAMSKANSSKDGKDKAVKFGNGSEQFEESSGVSLSDELFIQANMVEARCKALQKKLKEGGGATG